MRSIPFEFNLDLTFAIAGGRLDVTVDLVNTGAAPLPASFGFHPAFLWPLPYGAPRAEHRIVFAAEEGAPVRRLDADGLLDARPRPTPVQGRTLVLDDSLFTEDALIFTDLAGRSLSYGAPDGPQLHIHYPDTPTLGLWSKPGAPFVCIEPWQGMSDPAGFSGEIWTNRASSNLSRVDAGTGVWVSNCVSRCADGVKLVLCPGRHQGQGLMISC